METTTGFFALSSRRAWRIASLAVADPPGELTRTTTPSTFSSSISSRIAFTVGPETMEPADVFVPSTIVPERCITATDGLRIRELLLELPDIILLISSNIDISLRALRPFSTHSTSPSAPAQRAIAVFSVPVGASASTRPAARASFGRSTRSFWSSRTCSVVSPRPLAIIDTSASFIVASMSR